MEYWNQPIIFNQIGHAHLRENGVCEDAYSVDYIEDGNWIAITVCDGAGSALYGEQGAKIVSKKFNEGLISLAHQINKKNPDAWISDAILKLVLDVRNTLRISTGDNGMKDYHTTLVSILVNPKYGFSIHIGDGAIIGGNFINDKNGTCINENYFVSEPSNGEYANETFFITEARWIKNIHIKPIQNMDWLALGSDGGLEAIINNKGEMRDDLIAEFFNAMKEFPDQDRNELLEAFLNSEKYKNITSDDRTLIILTKNSTENYDRFYKKNNPSEKDTIKKKDQVEELIFNQKENIIKQNYLNIFINKNNLNNYIIVALSLFIMILLCIFAYNIGKISYNQNENMNIDESKKNKNIINEKNDNLPGYTREN